MSWSDYCPETSYACLLPLLLVSIPLYMYLHSSRERKGVLAVEPPHQQENMKHTLSPTFVDDVRNTSQQFLQEARRRIAAGTTTADTTTSAPVPSSQEPTSVMTSGQAWPQVWCAETEAKYTGFLGFQAAAAEGEEEHSHQTFYMPEAPKNWNHQHQNQYHELIQRKLPNMATPITTTPAQVQRPMLLPTLPAEIHLEIIKNLIPASESSKAVTTYAQGCGLCNLFQLSSLCKVNRFYYSIVSELLYTNLPLNVSTEVFPFDGKTLCEAHHHLSSKPQQLEKRLPLLLRTLRERGDLAVNVKAIHLPPSINCWLTCSLEKVLLPNLIDTCENVEVILGTEQLHERQFFSAEHYCLDEDSTQHGILAKTIVEKTSLTRVIWRGGDAGTRRSVWQRVFDGHPDMRGVGFIELHRNWGALKELGFFGVRGLTVQEAKVIFEGLPKLVKFGLGDVRVKRKSERELGPANPAVREARREVKERFMSILEALPESVRNVGFSDVDDEDFVVEVGKWAAARVAKSAESSDERNVKPYFNRLTFTRICFTAENLRSLLTSLAVEAHVGKYTYSRSAVKDLRLSNLEKKDRFLDTQIDTTLFSLKEDEVELRGLERLCWGVGSCEDKEASIGKAGILKGALRRGWFKSLKEVLVESDPTPLNVIEACNDRGLELHEFRDIKRQSGMVEW
ncbi:hypothetical protein DFP73DRAFT_535918 [Morchella snyderi]|nr:hypothetical protein DFP73DRAFT_535918 [Morchella snyderi]